MSNETNPTHDHQWPLVIVCWLAVGLPLAWGILMTVRKALLLFN